MQRIERRPTFCIISISTVIHNHTHEGQATRIAQRVALWVTSPERSCGGLAWVGPPPPVGDTLPMETLPDHPKQQLRQSPLRIQTIRARQ